MTKKLFFSLTLTLFFLNVNSQKTSVWTKHSNNFGKIAIDQSALRNNFPKEFQLFDLNINPLKQELFSIMNKVGKNTTIISLPNADGQMEQFEVNEASNFDAELQAKFPDIRAYSGKGITDRYATLKLSISPQGIQTMVFRTDKENEFIEAYSQDHTVYAVFKSQRNRSTGWACSTVEEKSVLESTSKSAIGSNTIQSSAGQLKTMRLALSCNAEYANYFGATSVAQVSLVIAAFNATLTRCNGVYEKDLGVHMNLVDSTTNVIYYDASTDPYSTTLSSWNTSLQKALNTTLTGVNTALAANNAAYDIGHMFGASGGGGNAGCIGCICVNGVTAGTGSTKGRGITSPSNGVPSGDSFDIDYVVHEMGHQMGANHTFSYSNEGAGVNKEVGSGITIMGYAGITSQDVAPNSIDIFHEASIEQIQNNLATSPCASTWTTLLTANATPVVQAVGNYIIPISTPFQLTGSATDANETDVLTYCWEQNDDGGANTGANSIASITKTTGPNFLSWSPTASPSRYFPKLKSIVANSNTTSGVGNDLGILTEALSSVSRVLNFRLTVRDNAPYSPTVPIKVGQTAYTDMVVNVTAAAGPFLVSAPNTSVSWEVGTNQAVTWAVAGTTANGINASYVDIFLSTDGGFTYPIQLASKVPNNGSAMITVPNNAGSTNRIMVKGYKHIFFDISNTNFSITAPTSSFAIAFNGIAEQQNKQVCQGGNAVYTIPYTAYAGFVGTTTFAATGLPAGVTATFVPSSLSASGTVTMTVSAANNAIGGLIPLNVSATSGATEKTTTFYFFHSSFGTQALTSPADLATTINPLSVVLTWPVNAAAMSYDVQIATDVNFSSIVRTGNVTTNSYSPSGLLNATFYYWRVLPKSPSCSGTYSLGYRFTTGQLTCNVVNAADPNLPIVIPTIVNTAPFNSTFNITTAATIVDLNVTVNITHTWVGDLTLKLTSPAGTVVTLLTNKCDSATANSVNNISATFDDSGTVITCGDFPAITGTIASEQLLSQFNGQNSSGNWTLTVLDPYNLDGGTINSWSLNVCSLSQAVLATVDNTLSNFVLYPNPNKGNFTVQFNSTSSNKIGISVHDMRGRLILNNTYNNTGLFSQNVQLDTIQAGVYLVNVQDGDKKVVKRIVIE